MALQRANSAHGAKEKHDGGAPPRWGPLAKANRLSSTLPSVKRRKHRIMQSHGVRPAHVMTRMTGLEGFVSSGLIEIGLKLRARPTYLFPAALLSEGLHDGAIRAA